MIKVKVRWPKRMEKESEFYLDRLALMAFQDSSPSTCIQQKYKNWGLFTDSR